MTAVRTPRNLSWISELVGSRPCWSTDPSLSTIEQLARQHLALTLDEPCAVTFFTEGAFNKLYSVCAKDNSYLMRVSLPVDPRWKTLSELATLQFVRETCTALVPSVLAYDADVGNELGFEWIIMERLPGKTLDHCWKTMSWKAKEQLVRQVVSVLASLYEHSFSGIGNIFLQGKTASSTTSYHVGRIVSMAFFWDKHYDQDVPRGPFRSSHDWLAARLSFVLNDSADVLGSSEDEDDIEEAEESKALAEQLIRLLPTLFPPHVDAPEPTVISHDDLSFHNILVDDDGKLTGIVDWECVSAFPLWKACQLPSFLVSPDRMQRPDPAEYATEEDGTPNQLFFENLREWEQTKLRTIFFEEMELLQTGWVNEYRTAERRADFEFGVQFCDDEFCRKRVKRWVEQMEKLERGETMGYISLRAALTGIASNDATQSSAT